MQVDSRRHTRTLTPVQHRWFVRRAAEFSPSLRREIAEIGPLTLPERRRRGLSHFLARAVIGQQLSTAVAKSIWRRIEGAAQDGAQSIPGFFRDDNAPALRQCGVSGNKVRALCAIREARELGLLSARRLQRLEVEERSRRLQEIRGVGPWTADMVNIFYFRDPDIWPQGDLAVRKTFMHFVEEANGLNSAQAAALFVPHRSFLALYMWRIVARGER